MNREEPVGASAKGQKKGQNRGSVLVVQGLLVGTRALRGAANGS
jgi:hypothetical protein